MIKYHSKSEQFSSYIKKLYNYRQLIFAFARRDLKSKYAQTRLGLVWVFIKPILSVLLYVFFFEFVLNSNLSGVPYSIYVFSGLIAWNLFSQLIILSLNAIQESAQIIKKIYFPKSILALSKALVLLIDSFIVLILLFSLSIYLGILPSWNLLFLPFAILNVIFISLTFVFLLSAISIKHKDIFVGIPFILQTLMWFSNVFIDVSSFPEFIQAYIANNPLSLMVSFMRWCLIGYGELNPSWVILFFSSLFTLYFSLRLYAKVEDTNVENI